MCGSAPSAPAPIPQRQAAKAPDAASIATRTSDQARKRLSTAASILTPQAIGLAPASTTGKALLGA